MGTYLPALQSPKMRVSFFTRLGVVGVSFELITEQGPFERMCERLESAVVIGFDTEFISEDNYQPELCLLQVAAGTDRYLVDPLQLADVTPFWQLLVDGDHVTLVHSGREEFRFCHTAVEAVPRRWFDVQLAAGLIGLEYPAAYRTLTSRLLGVSLDKGETRTNWRRRPLTDRQLDYAVQDVEHLEPLHDELNSRLEQLGRRHWFDEEMKHWLDQVQRSLETDRWRSVSGIGSLGVRSLAIARELWHWRDGIARRQDRLPRRVLRDDLLTELARRKKSTAKQIKAIRGMHHRHLQNHIEGIAEAIQRALDLPEDECPRPSSASPAPQRASLCQFLAAALNAHCRQARLAPNLVATMQDVRALVADRLDKSTLDEDRPRLDTGWRRELVGALLDDVMAGRIAVHVSDPGAEHPLALQQLDPTSATATRSRECEVE